MAYVAIRAAIKAKLDALVPGTLKCVFNGEQSTQAAEIPSWPAAELVRVQSQPDYETNREDMQTYVFVINLYMPLEETNWGAVEVAMDSVVDAVMQNFLDDVHLGGVIEGRLAPIENQVSVVSWQGRQVRREQILLRCPKIKAMA